MLEVYGSLWTYPAGVRVITTNGFVKRNGEAVMGRGCALEAAKKWAGLPSMLGDVLSMRGNHVSSLGKINGGDEWLFSFPVKHNWWEKADLALIERSAHELAGEIPMHVDDTVVVVLPRPGCGNGQLNWTDVKPMIADILDDRFHVITHAEEASIDAQ
jgi:hypothetical protein